MALSPSRKSSSDNHSNKKIKCYTESFNNLDDCINSNFNYESMRSRLVSHHKKNNSEKFSENTDLVPITFGLIVNNSSSNKTSQQTVSLRRNKRTNDTNDKKMKKNKKPVRILLDSGASASIISKDFVVKENYVKSNASQEWLTMAGTFKTTRVAYVALKLPELNHTAEIATEFHVTKQKSAYDVIFGRKLLKELGIVLDFNQMVTIWNDVTIPMKDVNAEVKTHFFIRDSKHVNESTKRIKKILDAKYKKADLEEYIGKQTYLDKRKQNKLLTFLKKYEKMFDGTLGTYKGSEYKIELKEGIKPYHAKPFPIPRIHEETLKKEVERLVKIGVLKRINNSEWAAPTFIIPKKNGTVRFISDFRELNKRIRRKPFPIPKIQDLLLKLEGFKYATSLDLNMGYYHIKLCPMSRKLCTIVLPWGKFEYQKLPMGLCNSPDIFQEKMNELFIGLEYVRAYIDDLLIISNGSFEDHLNKLNVVFQKLQDAGFKVNAEKSFFAQSELEYLGFKITRSGIMPLPDKVQAIQNIAEPKTKKQLRSFIGVINYYRDMWKGRSDLLAPLSAMTSKKAPWNWTPQCQKAFDEIKKVVSRETLLAYPDFNKTFEIHTDASKSQLGAVISQEGKPIAFYSRKLNSAQVNYTTTERELLSIVETTFFWRAKKLTRRIY